VQRSAKRMKPSLGSMFLLSGSFKVESDLDPLRSDPRFENLIQRLAFP
jgi:hypothetical protein